VLADDARENFRRAVLTAELATMSASQRAIFGAPFVTSSHGGARHRGAGFVPLRSPVTYRTVRRVLGVGEKTVGRARRLLASDRPDLVAEVEAGRVTLAEAVRRL